MLFTKIAFKWIKLRVPLENKHAESPTHIRKRSPHWKYYIALYRIPTHFFMQEPNVVDEEASIPTENAREDPNLNRTVAVRRKATKRTLLWDLTAVELILASPPPLQAKERGRSDDLKSPFPQQQTILLERLLYLTFR
jgi:hypothetical protein